MQILQGWKKVAYKQIIMYLYDLNYRYYLVNYNNFGSVTGMYRECLEAGVSYLLTQGVSDSNNTCFEEMRHYVEANLLWNVNLEYDVLALDFMKHFYKQGYEKMWELYNAIRNNYAYQQGLVDPSTGSTTGFLPQSTLYPLEFVRQLDILIHEALDAIAELEAIDNEQYTLLKNRIMREYISVIYLKLKLYRAHYSEAEQNEMIELFNYYTNLFGITHPGEGADMSGVFN